MWCPPRHTRKPDTILSIGYNLAEALPFRQEALRRASYHTSGQVRIPERNRMPGSPEYAQAVDSPAIPIADIHILWITAGLGCDGDTIAMTAATQPSIEDVLLGGIPWIPKVTLHNPFLALANGDDFLKAFHEAAEGKMENFILVVEGSIPNEHNKEEGYWASLGTDPKTGQPITTCEWIERLAPQARGVLAAGTW